MSTVNTEVREQQRVSGADQSYLLDALKKIILIRTVEQFAQDFSLATPPKYLGSAHFCAGQEAVPVATIAGLEEADQIVATYRGHGWALASGLTLLEVFGEICQRSVGVNGGRGGSAYMMAPWSALHRRKFNRRRGCADSLRRRAGELAAGNSRVVVVSIGDGAFNQGSTHEGLAYAAARRLPGADHLREQWLVGADTDFRNIKDCADRAACLRLRNARSNDRRNRSDRDPRNNKTSC